MKPFATPTHHCREAACRSAATPPPFICGEAAPFVRRAAALVIAALAASAASAAAPITLAPMFRNQAVLAASSKSASFRPVNPPRRWTVRSTR